MKENDIISFNSGGQLLPGMFLTVDEIERCDYLLGQSISLLFSMSLCW